MSILLDHHLNYKCLEYPQISICQCPTGLYGTSCQINQNQIDSNTLFYLQIISDITDLTNYLKAISLSHIKNLIEFTTMANQFPSLFKSYPKFTSDVKKIASISY